MRIPSTTTSKRYPTFIRKSKTLQRFSKQQKVFPRIGLDNCEERLTNGNKIVFSGSGNKGLWDVATMSMRGIHSCQNWKNWRARSLIGSMLDPYCGIIYTTIGHKTSKGERMSRRSVVRFVVNRKTGKPALFLERVYPQNYFDYANSNAAYYNLFKEFLERKTNLKVVSSARNHFIPESNAVRQSYRKSYRDSGIAYRKHPKYTRVTQIKVKSK